MDRTEHHPQILAVHPEADPSGALFPLGGGDVLQREKVHTQILG